MIVDSEVIRKEIYYIGLTITKLHGQRKTRYISWKNTDFNLHVKSSYEYVGNNRNGRNYSECISNIP